MRHQPWLRDRIRQLPRARGAVDVCRIEDNVLRLSGWLLHPRIRSTSVTVQADGRTLGTFPLVPRHDVLAVFPTLPPGLACGFDISCTLPDPDRPIQQLNLIGLQADTAVVHLPWTLRDDGAGSREQAVVPPGALMQRVSGNADPTSFATAGFQAAVDLLSVVHQHGALGEPLQLLDWGCGCARVTDHFVRLLPPNTAVFGCDIDAEAVAWSTDAVPEASFSVCGIEPPLPYASGTFDVVTASSVMTHLDRSRQATWLAEIRRVLKPGGLFVASTHGEFAAEFYQGAPARLREAGILDSALDTALDGIAPPRYYRGVFQSQRYTAEHWSRTLPVIDHIPAGLLGFQDVVVLRKPQPGRAA